jgi:hypothetical protein
LKFTLHILLAFYLVLKPLVPVLDYAVNYDYISKVLCINKNKPQIHCNGKCYLGKELAKNESQNDSKTKNSVQKVLDLYVPAAIAKISVLRELTFAPLHFNYEAGYSYLFLSHIFRPPVF